MFVSELDQGLEVDHLNRDRRDDRAVNLEAVTNLENHRRQRRFHRRGHFIEYPDIVFDSLSDASLAINRDVSYLWVCLDEGHPIRPAKYPSIELHWEELNDGQ